MKVITTNLLNRFWTNGVKPIVTNFNDHIKTAASTSVLGHVKFGTTTGTACQGNDTRLSNARIPTSHASTETSYGIGTASNYGHVKLSDTYNSEVMGGAAANGMAASQKALADAYDKLNTDMALKEVNWGDNLRIAYNSDFAIIYCIGISTVSQLRNINSNVKPSGTVYAPCMYKDSAGKWHHGLVQYNGTFTVQYFDTYPDAEANTVTIGSIVFAMLFKRG